MTKQTSPALSCKLIYFNDISFSNFKNLAHKYRNVWLLTFNLLFIGSYFKKNKKKRNLNPEISLLHFFLVLELQSLFDRFCCFFKARFFEQGKHVLFVSLNSRLIEWIDVQSIAA